jgi:uncharacterized protein DUF2752
MRIALEPPAQDRFPAAAVFGAITLLAAAASWVRVSMTLSWIPSLCLFRRMTGIPCPACHATRALASLATLRLGDALAFNPLITLVALFAALAALFDAACRFFGREARILDVSPKDGAALRAAAVIVIAANWIYLVATR